MWDPLRISATLKLATKFGLAYQKTTFWTKIGGVWAKGASKIIWDPLRISATAEASNFKFGTHIWFGSSLPKNDVQDQNWRDLGQGFISKNWDPLLISATIEASNFKFGTQLGFGTTLLKNNVLDQNWRGVGQGSIQKKFGTPYVFLQPLKLATSNLVHKLGLALAYQKTTFWTKIGGGLGRGSSQEKFGTPTYFCNR